MTVDKKTKNDINRTRILTSLCVANCETITTWKGKETNSWLNGCGCDRCRIIHQIVTAKNKNMGYSS